jgi:DNA topoisomerase-6 subunit A
MPAFVESDALSIIECSASGVLLVPSDSVFFELLKADVARRLNLLLVTGPGIPRFATRRLLYRLSTELHLPIFLLSDNSTWGYFIFSVLKRGALAPHERFDYASIRDLRFLGLRAGVAERLPDEKDLLRPWKRHWEMRLQCLREYPCFKKAAWQQEFSAFEKQHGSVPLWSLYDSMGADTFISTFLEEPLRRRQWLT